MKAIKRLKEKEIWFEESKEPYDFHSPFDGEQFVCFIFNNDPDITNSVQNQLSEKIIKCGCRYAVCAGFDCSKWDDSIDMAYLATNTNFNPSEKTFVMTSWHEKEKIEEVIFHAMHCTDFDNVRFSKYLVYFVGENDSLKEKVFREIENFR